MRLVNEHVTELIALLGLRSGTQFLAVHGRLYEFSEEIRGRCRRIATSSSVTELMETFATIEKGSLNQGYITFVFVLSLHYANEITVPQSKIQRFCKGNLRMSTLLIYY